MSDLTIGLLSFPALLFFIFLRVPIGLSMFLVGLIGMVLVTDSTNIAFARLKYETYSTFSNYSLSIIPMFILMGHFASLGGMSQALFKASESWLGHRKGGMAMAAIGACAGFGAICGSSLATAATMGRVALPELKKYGYSGGFSTATLAAGGTLGILIPPSVVLVIYAILAEQNIAKLFLAAFIPGILAALGYMVAIAVYARLFPQFTGTRPRVPYLQRFANLISVWPVLIVFALVVGGIYLGLFTPTEGAAIGALGTGVIAYFAGGINKVTLSESFVVTGQTTAMIFLIILGAAFYNGFLALTHLPNEAALWVGESGLSPLLILILILLIYLILGCFMDSLSMILLTIPIFWPVIQALDFGLVTMIDLHSMKLNELISSGAAISEHMISDAKAFLAAGEAIPNDLLRELGLRGVSEASLTRLNSEYTAIWFGILVLIVVEVGLITPPVGMNLFVINAMDEETSIVETYKAVAFFVAADLIRVAYLIAFPFITLAPLLL